MEMNIKNGSLSVCSCVCRTKNSFTAECDVIVPDSKPDILKVLQLSAVPRYVNFETKNGRVSASGTVCFTIVYLADDEEKSMKSITSSCEFSNIIRDDAISEFMLTFADVDVDEVNCNIVNCRKLTLKASLDMAVQVYTCFDLDLISEIEGACTQKKNLTSSVICAHSQSTTTLTDSFSLPNGKAPVCEIFRTDAVVTDSEIKVIDDKAVIKGNILITVLYRSEAGIEHIQNEIPFAHILQADGIREEMDTEFCVKAMGPEATVSENTDGELCVIEFSADLYFRVLARCTYKAECVTDAFLPHGNLGCKYSPVCVDSIETIIHRDAEIREKITLPEGYPPIAEVYQVILRPFIESCRSDGEVLKALGYADIYILYLSSEENSPVCSYKETVEFAVSCESPGCSLTPISDCVLKNFSYTINSDNCVEVRGIVDIKIQCVRTTEEDIIYAAEESEYIPQKRPSIIVSCVCNERSLWDIAKEYKITPESILSANALENEDGITPHMALIIPK